MALSDEGGRYVYDERAADRAVRFFSDYCFFTEDKWAGKPFVLAPWQEEEIVRPFFGWKRAEDGTRRFRTADVWVPRKNGKTELGAGFAHLALIGDGTLGGQVYSIAADKNQARLVFDKAAAMAGYRLALRGADDRDPVLTLFANSIWCEQLNASFQPLSGRTAGKHGLSATGLIGDEAHEWRDDRLYTFVHQSSAARSQPIELVISTAGIIGTYGYQRYDHGFKVLHGIVEDPELLVVIHAADPEDDWRDPEVWKKANPNFGISVQPSFLEAECRRALNNPRIENHFRRYHLNQWVEQASRWISILKWDECAGDVEWRAMADAMAGRRCFLGIDLAQTSDVNAAVYVFPPVEADPLWRVLVRLWVPEATIPRRVEQKVPYDGWVASGAMLSTPGNTSDYEVIMASISDDAQRFDVAAVAIDGWNSGSFPVQLAKMGLTVFRMGNSYSHLSGPSKELERLVLDIGLAHGGHPVLRWMVSNVAIKEWEGSIRPSKDHSSEKIDGVMALLYALAAALADEGAEAPSYVLTQGLVVL